MSFSRSVQQVSVRLTHCFVSLFRQADTKSVLANKLLQLPDPEHSYSDAAAHAQTADGVTGDTGDEVNKALAEANFITAQGNASHQPDVSTQPTTVVLQGTSMLLFSF